MGWRLAKRGSILGAEHHGSPLKYGPTRTGCAGNAQRNLSIALRIGFDNYMKLHQGTKMIPCDFIAPANSHNKVGDHHQKLLSNFFAQPDQQHHDGLRFSGNPHRHVRTQDFTENPITSVMPARKRSVATLGSCFFTQGVIWNINSYDQWGVELGKADAELNHDSSTNGLIRWFKKHQA